MALAVNEPRKNSPAYTDEFQSQLIHTTTTNINGKSNTHPILNPTCEFFALTASANSAIHNQPKDTANGIWVRFVIKCQRYLLIPVDNQCLCLILSRCSLVLQAMEMLCCRAIRTFDMYVRLHLFLRTTPFVTLLKMFFAVAIFPQKVVCS